MHRLEVADDFVGDVAHSDENVGHLGLFWNFLNAEERHEKALFLFFSQLPGVHVVEATAERCWRGFLLVCSMRERFATNIIKIYLS
eukprot:1215378-Amorphochlora_amoeboformis.AAC.1